MLEISEELKRILSNLKRPSTSVNLSPAVEKMPEAMKKLLLETEVEVHKEYRDFGMHKRTLEEYWAGIDRKKSFNG